MCSTVYPVVDVHLTNAPSSSHRAERVRANLDGLLQAIIEDSPGLLPLLRAMKPHEPKPGSLLARAEAFRERRGDREFWRRLNYLQPDAFGVFCEFLSGKSRAGVLLSLAEALTPSPSMRPALAELEAACTELFNHEGSIERAFFDASHR